MRRKKLFFIIPAAIVGIALFIFLGGWIVMSLWNYLLPALFGWRIITFWQALGLLILCRILFGGFGGHRMRHSSRRGRWDHLTPEEREKFREGMRAKWGFGPPASETPKV
jgi:MFS family permease